MPKTVSPIDRLLTYKYVGDGQLKNVEFLPSQFVQAADPVAEKLPSNQMNERLKLGGGQERSNAHLWVILTGAKDEVTFEA